MRALGIRNYAVTAEIGDSSEAKLLADCKEDDPREGICKARKKDSFCSSSAIRMADKA